MNVRKAKHGWIFTLVFTLISIAYVFPIALVVINSFKKKAYISKKPFAIPTDKMFVGIENYIKGIQRTGFIDAFFTSLFITVLSVGVIILCTSMCAWYISRVKTLSTKIIYVLCLFAMVYQPCKESFYNCAVFSVSVFDDRSVPDGNVYPVQACGYAEIK